LQHCLRNAVSNPCFAKLASGALAAAPSARYLLFLDDDVECHPATLRDLVGVLERDASLFMATGVCVCACACVRTFLRASLLSINKPFIFKHLSSMSFHSFLLTSLCLCKLTKCCQGLARSWMICASTVFVNMESGSFMDPSSNS
jgi:hypothetical protein